MLIKVFALGRPGSGKSIAAHRLAESAWNEDLLAIRLGDYEILQREAWQEEHSGAGALTNRQRRYRLTPHGGFDVLDFTVLDEALLKLKQKIDDRDKLARLANNDLQLVILEFARNNYKHAFEVLGLDALKDAFFLYVNADVEECIKRINERTLHPTSSDDHHVSEHILRTYYKEDDGCEIQSYLTNVCRIPTERIIIADNNCTPSEFAVQIATISEMILKEFLVMSAF
jgi:hypothetical protein